MAKLSYGYTSDIAIDDIELKEAGRSSDCHPWPVDSIPRQVDPDTSSHDVPPPPHGPGKKHYVLIIMFIILFILFDIISFIRLSCIQAIFHFFILPLFKGISTNFS